MIDPVQPPGIHGAPLGKVLLRATPEDFVVEEILGFEPSGEGEHVFLWVEKTGWNSNDVATHFAEALGIRRRLVSHCGLKDRHAVTRQWFGLHLPGQPSPTSSQLETQGIRILRQTRGLRKLRRGTHRGNRFILRLPPADSDHPLSRVATEARWKSITERGVPNYYGPQRFGRGGGNVDKARALFRDRLEVRDRALRGLYISAARSALFNAHIAQRIDLEIWDEVIDGEVFGFPDNRSLILPDRLRGEEKTRFEAGELELTGPLWGQGNLLSQGAVRNLESTPSDRILASGLAQLGLVQERRILRLRPVDPSLCWEQDDLVLGFALPKGTYATSIVREIAELQQT